jgi:hypothetical protein
MPPGVHPGLPVPATAAAKGAGLQTMPVSVNKFLDIPDMKVFIHNTAGQYLAGGAKELFFTNDRSLALVLDYRADRVPEQLDLIRRTHGITLVVDPVPLSDIYETCDRCKDLFPPFMVFFDGKRFLCSDCRRLAAHGPKRKTATA